MKKTIYKFIGILVVLLLSFFVISFNKKPLGGIKGIFTTCNFSGDMTLESSNSLSVSTSLHVKVKGFHLLSSGKFTGEIEINNIIINAEKSDFSILAYNDRDQYNLSIHKLPIVADNGIDLLPPDTYIDFSIYQDKAYLIITDSEGVNIYSLNIDSNQ